MNPLRVELYAERYQRQLDSLLRHDLDTIIGIRNRQFVADTIREVGVTESIRKRFGLESYDTSLLAARSWQTISSACSLDTDLCNKLLKNLKQLADAAK